MAPSQNSRLLFGANHWEEGLDVVPTADFIKQKLDDVLHGRSVNPSRPPEIDMLCSHSAKVWSIQ